MSNTPWSPARQSSGPVQTWVSSQWKFLPSQGQFSTAINSESVFREIGLGKYRADLRSDDWIGLPIGRVLGLYPENQKDKRKIQALIGEWLKTGFLKKEIGKDGKRREKEFVAINPKVVPSRVVIEQMLS